MTEEQLALLKRAALWPGPACATPPIKEAIGALIAEYEALRPTAAEVQAEDVVGARANFYTEDWTRLECKSSVNTLIRAAVRRRKARRKEGS